MSKKYYVDGIVCDYGVFYPNETENELICLCNFKSNAVLIADILNVDNEEVSKCWRDKKLDELYHQLAEKDLENKKFKYMILELQAKEQDQRHQICEEIKIKGYYCHNGEEKYYKITPSMLWEIEKGE